MCTYVIFLDAVMWSREDALGAIAAVEMLDLPAGQSEQIEAFVEMTKSEGNPLKVFALRAQLQFTLAKVGSSTIITFSILQIVVKQTSIVSLLLL